MVLDTYEEIKDYVVKHGKESIMDIAETILVEIKRFVEEKLYDSYTPTHYIRTNEFLRSFKVKRLYKSSSREFGFQIYIDYSEIISHPRDKYSHKWGQHASVYGEDTSKLIPLWMDKGHGGLYQAEGIEFMDYLQNLLNSDKIVKGKLKKKFEYEGLNFTSDFTSFGINFNFK